jgi:hypothetical protein
MQPCATLHLLSHLLSMWDHPAARVCVALGELLVDEYGLKKRYF